MLTSSAERLLSDCTVRVHKINFTYSSMIQGVLPPARDGHEQISAARGAVLAAAARVLHRRQELDGALQLHRGLAVLAGGRRPLRPRPPAGTEVRDGKGGRK